MTLRKIGISKILIMATAFLMFSASNETDRVFASRIQEESIPSVLELNKEIIIEPIVLLNPNDVENFKQQIIVSKSIEELRERERLIQLEKERLAKEAAKQEAKRREEVARTLAVSKTYTSTTDLRNPSGLTEADLNKVLKGTGLEGLGNAFIKADEQHEINALFLVSLAVHESGWGKSGWSKSNNNIFGIDSGRRYFSSKTACIDYTAGLISKNYVSSNGKYYNGPNVKGININYCPPKDAGCETWSSKVVNTMNYILKKI